MKPIGNPQSPIVNPDSLLSSESPWPGLAAFTEDARGFFFGRENETDELLRLVRRQTLTVLFGQSGLGKSSLLQAGVFPRLREADFLPLYLRLNHDSAALPLADQVKTALAEAIKEARADAPAPRADESLWEYFHRNDIDIWSAKNRLLTPVLAFDQFEEIFTLGRAEDSRRARGAAFLSELADLVENRPPATLRARFDAGELDPARYNFDKPSCRIVLTLREDFLPDLEGLKGEMRSILTNRMRIRRLTGTQALEIVTKPAPHLLAEGVAERVVEFVAGARGGSAERFAEIEVEPSLLSVICRELNERRRALGQDKITTDLVTGNRREILNNFYERSVADLPAAMREFVEDRLLTKSGFRDNFALETALEIPGVTREFIDALVLRRLLRIEEHLGVPRVELAHDVLAEVVRASRDARQQRLAVAEAEKREQVALAIAARQARRQRFAIAGLILLVIALGAGVAFGLRAQRRATEQAARADLATGSRLLDEGKVGDGLAYLVSAASRQQDNGIAATRILTALTSRSFSLPFGTALNLPSRVVTLRFLAGGKSALALGEDGIVRLIDAAEWKMVREFKFDQKVHPYGLRTAAKNPGMFAAALVNGTIVVCDIATGRPRFAPITPPGRVAELGKLRQEQKRPWYPNFALSPDGRWIRTINDSWTIFDATTGEERSAGNLWHTVQDSDPTLTQFSPDSRRFVTSSATVTGVNANGGFSTSNYSMELRSVPDGKVLTTFPTDPKVSAPYRQGTIFSADGKRLLVLGYLPSSPSTGSRPAAFVHDTETLALVGPSIPFEWARVSDLSLTPDGKQFVITSSDRTVTVYDVATGKPAFPALLHGGPVWSAGISDDSSVLATVSADGLCRLWDLKTGRLAAESTYRRDRPSPAALSPDGRTLLVTSSSGLVRRLQTTGGPVAPLVLPRKAGSPILVQFTAQPPARLLWFETRRAKAIDIATGRLTEGSFNFPFAVATSNTVNVPLLRWQYGFTLRPGDTLIARTTQAAPRAWIMGTNGVAQDVPFADPLTPGTGIVLSASGKFGAGPVVLPRETRSLGIWDLHTGKRVGKVAGFPFTGVIQNSLYLNFSPDDRRLAVFEPKVGDTPPGLRVHETVGAKPLCRIPSDEKAPFRTVRFSSDSTRLLTGNGWGNVQVWDATTGKLLQSNQAHGFVVTRFDFSDDGKLYASLSQDGTVQVWDSATDEPVGTPLVHASAVDCASFSADNTRISTAAGDGSGRVWDVRSGLPLNDPVNHQGEVVTHAVFSPDNRYVGTAASTSAVSGAVRVWAAPPAARTGRAPKWLLQLATICAGRRLNEAGKMVSAVDEFEQLDEIRREIADLPDGDAYAEWVRWFLSDSPTRPIAPGFTITPAEAKKFAEEMSVPDPLIAWTTRDNALLLESKFTETEPLERQMLAWVIKRDGEGASVHGDHLIKLAQTLVMVGKFEEAEKLARASLALREKDSAPDSYRVQSARATVGSALVGQKRFAEAEPLLAEGCAHFKKLDAAAVQTELVKLQMRNRVASLVQLYEATGRPEKAAEWRQWSPRAAPPTAPAPSRTTTPALPPPAAPAATPPTPTPKK